MIKVELNYSDDFITRYTQSILTETLYPAFNELLGDVPFPFEENMRRLFCNESLHDIVFLDPEELVDKIVDIYDSVPILSERYCIEYYLEGLVLSENIVDIDLMPNENKIWMREERDRVVDRLLLLIENRESVLIQRIIDDLRSENRASRLRITLKKLLSMMSGNNLLSREEKALFPNWVNEFANIFNYNQMAKNFGNEMTSSLHINFCPYCNQENTETITAASARSRPDLDHFHPKSKFPFLALTLSNLIPSGHRCNQTYKKSKIMLNKVHPYLDGVGSDALFNFNFSFHNGYEKENLNITVNELGQQIDNNIDFFKIENVYNQDSSKEWFMEFHERYEYRRCVDREIFDDILDDPNSIRMELAFDILKSPKIADSQKFKIDALQQLSGRPYPLPD
ncbi:hypothetical protein [Vibrio sp. 10N.261.46.A3]|uniref:hypothetical protein n=1 Tax=Vibrio sp. 10N.261.46.A3 TaxID=3229658 RepID=UPI003551947A